MGNGSSLFRVRRMAPTRQPAARLRTDGGASLDFHSGGEEWGATAVAMGPTALLEVDSVMFNGDDENFGRNPVMLHAHAWSATEMAAQFVPAGYGPSWYKLHYDANMRSV